jgi:hypothetical protein
VSLLDDRDLLALRLVSAKTRDWVDAVMFKHPTKAFAIYVDENTALQELTDEEMNGIPFFRGLNITNLSFFSHPLIPSFLRIYASQIHTVYRSEEESSDVVPEEVAFYQSLPNLTQLSTHWLGDSVPDVKLPALERLQLHSVGSTKINFDFLQHLPNLRHLWLPDVTDDEYVKILIALGPYFETRNRWKGSSGRALSIFVERMDTDSLVLNTSEGVTKLLRELAVADGRILIDKMPVQLLDEAVSLFRHQGEGRLLRSFGKCIQSLNGFSSLLSEVELPNMRKLDVSLESDRTGRDGDVSRTVSWPKLQEVKLSIMRNEYLAQLLFGSGVLRPSVKRLDFDLRLLSLGPSEAHLGLGNFPNLTHLELVVRAEDVGLFRSLIRVLHTSCRKLEFLYLFALCPLRDEYFLGVDEEGGLTTTPPLLQFPGKQRVSMCAVVIIIT